MSNDIIVIGAGGHARSVMDILLRNGEYNIIGCIDNSYGSVPFVQGMADIPIIGNDEMLADIYKKGIRKAIVALGKNSLRKKLYERLLAVGFEPISAISRHAVISPSARVGAGTCVMAGAVINVNTVIGENCIINTNCSLDHDCVVGSHCHIAPGVAVSGTVSVGDLVQIGTGACVIDGMTIGRGSFIGAGAAVVKNIPENVLAYGVPARVIKTNE